MKPIYVTKPYLPDLAEYLPYLQQIWQTGVITNVGPMHTQLEHELENYLGVKHVSLVNNATIGLIIAIKALELRGQVITTPFSFVATAHSLLWNEIVPVFADIDPVSLNITPETIEPLINEHTTAIMPVHVYGRPCDVDGIQKLADKYNLKVIYDAAHAFGVNCHCGSVLSHGDISVLSFHATKVFNTFEGGAIIAQTPELKKKINSLRNFGIEDELTITACGINGKMSEINAAMGLLQLTHVDSVIEQRQLITEKYLSLLARMPAIKFVGHHDPGLANYSYFPVLVDPNFGVTRDQIYEHLKKKNIFSRRYFYPLLSETSVYKNINLNQLPVANQIANNILCLPLYPGLVYDELKTIVSAIKELYD